jgi:ribose/xylose/arabinose/galactoside ABC-type transport system permease subunit
MALLYLGGSFVNPHFFGSIYAFHALLRDTARYAVMAVGMTFVIVNKDLDLSVGSTFGLISVVFSMAFARFSILGRACDLICLSSALPSASTASCHDPAVFLHCHPDHAPVGAASCSA